MTRLALGLIRFYQRQISPGLPPSCRYQPTCSEYMAGAIARHGVLRGGLMGTRRLLRCTPLHKGGYDPVPGEDDGQDVPPPAVGYTGSAPSA